MVNLTIRLGKAGADGKQEQAAGGGINSVAPSKGPLIPPHLVDTDLPLLKGVGIVFPEPCAVNFVGVKARRRPGDKVHICVRCNFPIAVYGRLIPCEHVFCLTCAKLDPACFLCEERVTRIQKMDVLEGIFICGAPGCLRSFLARSDFDLHITEAHPQLLQMEQGRLSPERNVPAGNSVPEPQVQSHQSEQHHADFAPPARQSSGTLQVILPKKEEPQRGPVKGIRQDPQGLLGRPVPELRLPDQFPRHRGSDQHNTNLSNRGGGDQHTSREREIDVDLRGRDQKPWRRSEWDKIPQGQGENERMQMHEAEPQRRREEGGSNHAPAQKKSGEKDKGLQPPSFPTPKADQQQKQSVPSLPPPPPPYPPPNFSPAYLPQQDGNSFSSRFDDPRGFHPGYHEGFNQNGPLRPLLDGYGQNGPPRPMNGSRPHFYPDYVPPMNILPMGAPRYHEAHLPPPPPGPPPKRTKFSGEPVVDYNNWGPGNPGNFGGHPGYPNWMPPANT